MKNKLISIAMLVALSTGFNVSAGNIDKTTMSIEKSEFKRGHKMKSVVSEVVYAYMLEQGDITQGEIDIIKAEREAARTELKALKEAGDTEGFEAKKAELKAQYKERREAMKTYIDSHEDLKAQLKEKKKEAKKEMREKRKEKRKERKQKRKEMKAAEQAAEEASEE